MIDDCSYLKFQQWNLTNNPPVYFSGIHQWTGHPTILPHLCGIPMFVASNPNLLWPKSKKHHILGGQMGLKKPGTLVNLIASNGCSSDLSPKYRALIRALIRAHRRNLTLAPCLSPRTLSPWHERRALGSLAESINPCAWETQIVASWLLIS